MSSPTKHFYEFGPFRLDPERPCLLRGDEQIPLTPKALELLLILVRNSGRLVEKEELLKAVWPDTFVEEGNLSVTVFMLRRALGESADERRYIETVPRRGYRFVEGVREVGGEAAGLVVRRRTRSQVVIEEEETEDEAAPPPARKGPPTLAVLPLKPLRPEAADEYLGLGMADALITKLGNIKRIIVRPTSTTLKHALAEQDPQAVGERLGVDTVLDGRIQREGDRIRVTVQLVNVGDGATLWAEKFDTQFTNIFGLQDSVSEEVARALMHKLTGEEQRLLAKHFTDDTAAYQLYLRGRYHWNQWTEEGMKKAIESFGRAIEADPGFALAHAGLADCYAFGILPLPPQEAAPKAKEAALRALELDAMLAEAHTSLAYVKHSYDWDWAGAEMEFRRAIELNPNYAHAYHMYSHCLVTMNRLDDSLAASRRACQLDPLDVEMSAHLIFHYNAARQFALAIEQGRKTVEMDPNFHEARLFLGRALVHRGMYAEAIAELERAVELSGRRTFTLAGLGYACAVAGQRERAEKIAAELEARFEQSYVPAYYIAQVHAGLGDRERAFSWLERAYADRDSLLVNAGVDPHLDSLRSDSRFVDLSRRIGLEAS